MPRVEAYATTYSRRSVDSSGNPVYESASEGVAVGNSIAEAKLGADLTGKMVEGQAKGHSAGLAIEGICERELLSASELQRRLND